MDTILSPFRQSKLLNTVFLSSIFFSFHYFLLYYINSSFLSNFFSQAQLSTLYIVGSIIDTIFLLNATRILNKIGAYRFTLYTIALEFLSTVGMAISHTPFLIGVYFMIHLVVISLLLFNFDLYVEAASPDKTKTGGIRATYLTITNLTVVIAPSLVALLLLTKEYSYVYILSALFLVPLYFFIQKFRTLPEKQLPVINVREIALTYIEDNDLYNIFSTQFLLQLFYAFMGIYMPIYLQKVIGFSWSEIGVMFTIMLLPFVIFELPVGNLADKKYGEKEFLTIGFVILSLSTIFISFVTVKVFWIWAAILFITRIGASFIEITCESYFFKHVSRDQTDTIGFFRIGRPFSFVIAPILATLSTQFIPFQYTFILIGGIMILGCHYSLALNDTK